MRRYGYGGGEEYTARSGRRRHSFLQLFYHQQQVFAMRAQPYRAAAGARLRVTLYVNIARCRYAPRYAMPGGAATDIMLLPAAADTLITLMIFPPAAYGAAVRCCHAAAAAYDFPSMPLR